MAAAALAGGPAEKARKHPGGASLEVRFASWHEQAWLSGWQVNVGAGAMLRGVVGWRLGRPAWNGAAAAMAVVQPSRCSFVPCPCCYAAAQNLLERNADLVANQLVGSCLKAAHKLLKCCWVPFIVSSI